MTNPEKIWITEIIEKFWQTVMIKIARTITTKKLATTIRIENDFG